VSANSRHQPFSESGGRKRRRRRRPRRADGEPDDGERYLQYEEEGNGGRGARAEQPLEGDEPRDKVKHEPGMAEARSGVIVVDLQAAGPRAKLP
jgi:hypothetical protein